MKLKRFLLGALPFAMLAACSNEDVPGNGNINSPYTEADGFVSVNLQLPTNQGTRANDNFDDGAASEYNVNEGILVLFKGANEADAKYCGAYDLQFPKVPDGDKAENGNVTVSYKRAVKIVNPKWLTGDLYALVFINQSQANIALSEGIKIEDAASTTDATINGLKIGDFPCTNETTFSEIAAQVSSQSFTNVAAGATATSIFMTNSPLVEGTPGAGNEVPASVTMQTLVKLDETKIKPTEAEALETAAAGTIYVERAVAKITCSKIMGAETVGNGIASNIEMNDGAINLVIKNVEWALGNEEALSYVVRNVTGINWSLNTMSATAGQQYRMVGEKSMKKNMEDASSTNLYRPYWSIDPKYNVDKENKTSLNSMIKWDANSVLYAHENTFDVAHQNYGNTTRIGMWVTFATSADGTATTFYTRNGNKKVLYFDKDDKTPFENDVLADLSNNEAVRNAWEAGVKAEDGSGSIEGAKLEDYIDIKVEPTDAGVLQIVENGLTWKKDKFVNVPDNAILANLIKPLNSTYQYYEYKDGKAFYEVRIKHFGDDLTPWNITTAATTIDEAYPVEDRDNKYLGRYGMVRNNWYDLEIRDFVKLGDPRDPAEWDANWSNTPDDNNEQYIALRIAVLSWAKRTQIVDF